MAILKPANGPHTLTVKAVTQEEGNFGPQVKFDGGDNIIYLSEAGAMQQLARLNLNPLTAVGQTLVFSQTKKDGKTFNNISLPGANDPAPSSAASHAAPVRQAPKDMTELTRLYAECVDSAMMTLGAKLEAAGVPFSGSDIAAGAATLFIQANK